LDNLKGLFKPRGGAAPAPAEAPLEGPPEGPPKR